MGQLRKRLDYWPSQFGLNASVARTFRVSDRYSLDLQVASTNALNHVVFTAWNTNITNNQLGLPTLGLRRL
jgi:trimeric autotransporter adhesin